MKLLHCIIYIIISGFITFLIGRIYPRKLIYENHFPFKSFKFEIEGKIYEKLKIQKWKTKLPDASVILNKIIPGIMPKKRMDLFNKDKINTLIKESCVAEITHLISSILGFFCIKIWKKRGGLIISILYFILNIPFIIIQRYNRPRLKKMLLLLNN